MLQPTTKAEVVKLLLTSQLLGNLRGRWQDEKRYENIADYCRVLQKHIPGLASINRQFRMVIETTDCGKRVFWFRRNALISAEY